MKALRTLIILFGILFTGIIISACGGGGGGGPAPQQNANQATNTGTNSGSNSGSTSSGSGSSGFQCPKNSDDATLTKYGPLSLLGSVPESEAHDIVSNCGWTLDTNYAPDGVLGDTAIFAPSDDPDGSVGLIWIGGTIAPLNEFKLKNGWKGQFKYKDSSLKIGDNIEAAKAVFPTLQLAGETLYYLYFDSPSIESLQIYVDGNNAIIEIDVIMVKP